LSSAQAIGLTIIEYFACALYLERTSTRKTDMNHEMALRITRLDWLEKQARAYNAIGRQRGNMARMFRAARLTASGKSYADGNKHKVARPGMLPLKVNASSMAVNVPV
jgi:hypothetical protein